MGLPDTLIHFDANSNQFSGTIDLSQFKRKKRAPSSVISICVNQAVFVLTVSFLVQWLHWIIYFHSTLKHCRFFLFASAPSAVRT